MDLQISLYLMFEETLNALSLHLGLDCILLLGALMLYLVDDPKRSLADFSYDFVITQDGVIPLQAHIY